MKILYYYYYLFYSKILVQNDPGFVTVLALSFAQSLWITAILDFATIQALCIKLDKFYGIGILVILLAWNFYYYNAGMSKKIIKERPMIWKNHSISIALVLTFTLIAISWMFWGSFYARAALSGC
jgi:hypothetical protein